MEALAATGAGHHERRGDDPGAPAPSRPRGARTEPRGPPGALRAGWFAPDTKISRTYIVDKHRASRA